MGRADKRAAVENRVVRVQIPRHNQAPREGFLNRILRSHAKNKQRPGRAEEKSPREYVSAKTGSIDLEAAVTSRLV